MKQLLIIAAIAAAFVIPAVLMRRKRSRYQFANIGEGIYGTGNRGYLADAALVKIGSDANHIAICGVSDIPLGIIDDEAEAAEQKVNVAVFGAIRGTRLAVASAAIAAGDMIVPAASGRIRTLPATTGTYYICGRAINAASAAGDLVEIAPCFPIQRVVP